MVVVVLPAPSRLDLGLYRKCQISEVRVVVGSCVIAEGTPTAAFARVLKPRGHGQQVPDGYLIHPGPFQLRDVFDDGVIRTPYVALLDGDADESGHKRLRRRERRLGGLAVVTVEVSFVQEGLIMNH